MLGFSSQIEDGKLNRYATPKCTVAVKQRRLPASCNNPLAGCRRRKQNGAIKYMAYYVRNLRSGSRPAPAGYSSWLDYWEKKTGRKAGYCHERNCFGKATDGAHVQIVNGSDEWYIVPLCHPCNLNYGASFEVSGPLVPVDPARPIKW